MKAWRLEAEKINKDRKVDRKIPSARKQMQERLYLAKVFEVKSEGNWLLAGLMVHASYNPPTIGGKEYIPVTEGKASFIERLTKRLKRWF